ncbi:hypothetical protein, partial [Priestia megaterium]|uniref:hypothetical protein n=1 Tax=Priestia megaterium TaxID=1404 RepID=UPI002FFE1E5F
DKEDKENKTTPVEINSISGKKLREISYIFPETINAKDALNIISDILEGQQNNVDYELNTAKYNSSKKIIEKIIEVISKT